MLHLLDDELWFPPATEALEDGLLAIGGDLSVDRLLLAYRNGIFPWFSEDEPPMWWCPDPRFVLFPDKLKVSKSMQQVLRSGRYQFKTNTAFEQVIHNCRNIQRQGQDGTWIGDEVEHAYCELHNMGIAQSAEAWYDGELVGGLYGLRLGNAFFGESMFSYKSNASKFAFINYVRLLQADGVQIIDCQVYTEHLESFGAIMIPRTEFLERLQAAGV